MCADGAVGPVGWTLATLGEHVQIVSGGTPSTSVSDYWDGAIPWCTPTDITGARGSVLASTERTITEAGLKSSGATLLPRGAVLLCSRATIGEAKIAGVPLATNQGFKSLIAGPSIDATFLYYLVLSLKPELIQRGVGSTFLEVSRRDVAGLPVWLPPIAEQRAIAAALADADEWIASLEARICKQRWIRDALVNDLLRRRSSLPGGGGGAESGSDWPDMVLGEVAEVLVGGTPSVATTENWNGGIPWATPEDISAARRPCLLTTKRTISPIGLAASAARLLPEESVLVSARGTVGTAVYSGVPMATNQSMLALVPRPGTSGRWLYYWVAANRRLWEERAEGSTFSAINAEGARSLPMALPPLSEQRAIAEVLSDADASIADLEDECQKALLIKEGMMQALLSGDVRLPVAEQEAAAA